VTFHEVIFRSSGSDSLPGMVSILSTFESIEVRFGIKKMSLLKASVTIPSLAIDSIEALS
jgi:hypothetical protein